MRIKSAKRFLVIIIQIFGETRASILKPVVKATVTVNQRMEYRSLSLLLKVVNPIGNGLICECNSEIN